MTKYLSAETLIALNQMAAGPQAGVRDPRGVHSAAYRPRPVFGHDLYPTVELKAATLLWGIATSQHFIGGNKRTAWAAADLFLRINGVFLRDLPLGTRKAFVIAVALKELEVEEIAEWFEQNALTGEDRCRSLFVALEAVRDVRGAGSVEASGAFMADFQADQLPVEMVLALVAQIEWRSHDALRAMPLTVRLEPLTGSGELIGATPQWLRENEQSHLVLPGHEATPDNANLPYAAVMANAPHARPTPGKTAPMYHTVVTVPVPIVVFEPGLFELVVELDGSIFGRRRINVRADLVGFNAIAGAASTSSTIIGTVPTIFLRNQGGSVQNL